MPSLVTYATWTPIFAWFVVTCEEREMMSAARVAVRCGFKNGRQKDKYHQATTHHLILAM